MRMIIAIKIVVIYNCYVFRIKIDVNNANYFTNKLQCYFNNIPLSFVLKLFHQTFNSNYNGMALK